jgi:hypothetical protein
VVSYSEVVITLDFESSILGSNPGKRRLRTIFWTDMLGRRTSSKRDTIDVGHRLSDFDAFLKHRLGVYDTFSDSRGKFGNRRLFQVSDVFQKIRIHLPL